VHTAHQYRCSRIGQATGRAGEQLEIQVASPHQGTQWHGREYAGHPHNVSNTVSAKTTVFVVVFAGKLDRRFNN
jgi:hypothetical protein